MSVDKLPFCEIEIAPTSVIFQVVYNYPRYMIAGKRYSHMPFQIIHRTNTLSEVMHYIRDRTRENEIKPDAMIWFQTGKSVVSLQTEEDWVMALLCAVP